MNKIISFSLWGDNPKYTIGSIRNIELQKKFFPDWKCRFYIDEFSVPENILVELSKSSEIIKKGRGDWRGMFWRFEAAEDADIMISRDCDSRLSEREMIAVNEWLQSKKDFHIIRDHPGHGTKILGGMWGVRNGILKNIKNLLSKWTPDNRWQTDQEFLTHIIHPVIKNNSFIHDEIGFYPQEETHKISHFRQNGEHIGGVFDSNDHPRQIDIDMMLNYQRNKGVL